MKNVFHFRKNHDMFYGWWLAIAGAGIMALGTVPMFQGLPLWNPILRNSFGWTASQMSWAFAVTRIEGGLLGPVEGFLIERVGPRRMVFIGLTILGTGFLMFSQINELWQLYGSFFVMSIGAALGGWLPMMTVMNAWFVRKKAVAMSIVMEGFAIGGIILPVIYAWLIGGTDPMVSERLGWRMTAVGVGVVILILAFPMSRLIHNRPEDIGLKPDGKSTYQRPDMRSNNPKVSESIKELDFTWQQAIRTRNFWLISIGHACSSIVFVSLTVHIGILFDDRGFSLQSIGFIVATMAIANAVFLFIGAYIGDRVPIRIATFMFSAIQMAAVVVLVVSETLPMAFLFALLLGMGFGGRTPLTSAIRGVYFGRRAFAAIMGISQVPMNILLFAMPLFAGYMRDATGTYDTAFLIIGTISILGSSLFLLLGDPKASQAISNHQHLVG
ncbi:MFS transporter [SAR202 cluster bacterium AD-804-J14_MRT_500m]|nr:MFS transporter [SAR202 cluster bacterium AD-804-J14_MRT_500m]